MGVSGTLVSEINQYGAAYAAGFVATAVNVNLAVAVPVQVITVVHID
ncbi:MAG: hypothetical protein NVS2B16_37680 [Chloroflexota bacterium]